MLYKIHQTLCYTIMNKKCDAFLITEAASLSLYVFFQQFRTINCDGKKIVFNFYQAWYRWLIELITLKFLKILLSFNKITSLIPCTSPSMWIEIISNKSFVLKYSIHENQMVKKNVWLYIVYVKYLFTTL